MNRVFVLFVVLVATVAFVNCAATQSPQKAQRLQLARSKVVIESPAKSSERELRYDRKTGKEIYFDPKPRVELVDARSGKYALKWVGYDGKEKVVHWQRGDAIDTVVTASVTRSGSDQYKYVYRVKNLPSSGQNLINFIAQNFASDARPLEVDGRPTSLQDLRILKTFREAPYDGKPRNLEEVSIGEMSNDIQQFKYGNWIVFALLPTYQPAVGPGRELEVALTSSQPPGLVECVVRGGSDLAAEPVDEEMPAELEQTLPGYEQFPRGFTIGPVDGVKKLSPNEHAKYIVDRLPQFEKLGWMTSSARSWYEKNLRGDNLDAVLKRAEQDLKSDQITSEVFAMVGSIK